MVTPVHRTPQALVTAELTCGARATLQSAVTLLDGGALRGGQLANADKLVAELRGKDLLIVGYEQVTAQIMDACPQLGLIASIRGGPEAHIDLEAATTRGIPALYTVGRNAHAVAEHTFALMLALARHVPEGHRLVQERILTHETPYAPGGDILWRLLPGSSAAHAQERLIGSELYGKTLSLVGLGAIGQIVARLGQAFGMQVCAYDPFAAPTDAADFHVTLRDLPEVLRRADFLSLHARITPQSVGLIGRAELTLLKPSAYLINTARAALIDEAALIDTLQTHQIAGAALDVFHREPLPPDYPLLGLENVILTPHLAGWTREIPEHYSAMVAHDVLTFLCGAVPLGHLANPAVMNSPAFMKRGGRLLGARVSV